MCYLGGEVSPSNKLYTFEYYIYVIFTYQGWTCAKTYLYLFKFNLYFFMILGAKAVYGYWIHCAKNFIFTLLIILDQDLSFPIQNLTTKITIPSATMPLSIWIVPCSPTPRDCFHLCWITIDSPFYPIISSLASIASATSTCPPTLSGKNND